jgi:DNA-binding response OmpR family regulator
MSTGSSDLAAGQEVLVVDGDSKVVRGLESLLQRLGLVVTATADPVHARDLLLNKFFAVALLDVDTPAPGQGLELLRFVRESAPLTSVIVMTARKAFDIGVAGFREGASDVVVKEPDSVPYLKDQVLAAAARLRTGGERDTLLEEVAEVHEEFLQRMRDLARQRLDLEDRMLGRDPSDGGELANPCTILLVDDDADASERLAAALPTGGGWRVSAAYTGGEALDFAAQERPQIVLVKEALPDLPGRMVVTTIRAAAPDAVTLLYSPPPRAGQPGEVKMVEGSRVIVLVQGYARPDQLVAPLTEVREGIRQKLRERRYLQAFRQGNLDFLQRYQTVRQKIQAAQEKQEKWKKR